MTPDPTPTPPAGTTGEPVGAASGTAGTRGRAAVAAPFDRVPEDAASILDAAEANLAASRRLGAQRLQLAYAWATAHEQPLAAPARPRGSRLKALAYRELGGTGLRVAEDAPAELGISLELSSAAARALMAEAIDLVHRLPHTWSAVRAGTLEPWVGQKIARLTRALAEERARWVDTQLAGHHQLPTGRLLALAEARTTAADTHAADTDAATQRRGHTLHLGRRAEQGSRTLFARCDAADALRLYRLADQIAHTLRDQSDPQHDAETLDQLRARALGILANPALALSLLGHATPDTDTDADPDVSPGAPTPAAAPPAPEPLTPEPLSPELLDRAARAMRGRTTLYLHLTPAMLSTGLAGPVIGTGQAGQAPGLVARAEEIGALTRDLLLRLLGHEHVTVKPVINLAEHLSSDRYEVPAAIAERLHLAKPHDVFPYATSLARTTDQDHTSPWRPSRCGAGEPMTHLGNLGKLTRHHHRIKTHAPGWRTWQLDDHTHLWRTPHGRYRLVDQHGTHTIDARTDTGPPDTASPLERRLAAFAAA